MFSGVVVLITFPAFLSTTRRLKKKARPGSAYAQYVVKIIKAL
jgi:hypothetical protein